MNGDSRNRVPLFVMPKFVSIKSNVERLYPRISAFCQIYSGVPIPEDAYTRLVDTLAELFRTSTRCMTMSCNYIHGVEFTPSLAYKTLWRLWANHALLKEDRPVLYYNHFSQTGTEEIQFVSMVRKANNGTQTPTVPEMFRVKIKVLTGHFATQTFKSDFSARGVNRILVLCGYHGRKYLPGRAEECLPGLFAKALLTNYLEDSKVFTDIVPSDDISAFNRKQVISPRLKLVCCPFEKTIGYMQCRNCSVTRDKCYASYQQEND